MIELKNVNKYFNRRKSKEIHVINNTSLSIDSKGLVALLGPSGSGKTTLLNVIGGLDKINSGKIFVNGKKITSKIFHSIDKTRNLNIGYIFQDYKLVNNVTVFDNIALTLKMIGIKDKEEIKVRVNYVLETIGMYRYRNRLAGMLSGGEQQRVGIARAIVKNPNIIIADEPTGNLDSQNSIEVMNIIKAISKDRLVVLVTHEVELAKFYATRIIELEDGKIVNDYENNSQEKLDYKMDNKFYLKDFAKHKEINQDNVKINIYSNSNKNIDIKLIVKNGNIYIKSETTEKIEAIDNSSNIELINDNYKEIDKQTYEKYEFNFEKVINKDIKQRYSSILNPFTMLTNGFKKILDYSIIKKILLLGFIASAMFIVYAVSSIFASINIKDENFISANKNYLSVQLPTVTVENFETCENLDSVNYCLPGDTKVSFKVKYDEYYQTSTTIETLTGSLSSVSMINKDNLIYGRMPENNYEIVVDKMIINSMFNTTNYARQAGIISIEGMINKTITMDNLPNFTIVGIVDLVSPSIYANKDIFISILANSKADDFQVYSIFTEKQDIGEQIFDYEVMKDKIVLEKGRVPENDYEVVVNISNKDTMKLNKTIYTKINDTKLTVVGYYSTKEVSSYLLVNNNTLKYNVINSKSNLTIYPKNKEQAISDLKELNLNVVETYENDRNIYIKENFASIKSSLIVASVILVISLVEILLIIRSSFLSRVKEIGIFRAIGMKKSDIYKMFVGEIIAITSTASLFGLLLMSYILKALTTITYFQGKFMVNTKTIIISLVLIYGFNIIFGLLPVFNTIRKTPAQILSRHDIE